MATLPVLHSISSPSSHMCGLAWVNGHLWYSDGKESTLYELNPSNGEILTRFQIPHVNTSLSYSGGYLWQVTGGGYLSGPKTLTKISVDQGKPVEVIQLGADSKYIAGVEVQGDKVWVSLERLGRLQQRELYTNRILKDFHAEPRIAGIAAAGETFYYCEFNQSLLVEIDPENGYELVRHPVVGNPTGLTWDGKYVWYNDYTGKRILMVEPRKKEI